MPQLDFNKLPPLEVSDTSSESGEHAAKKKRGPNPRESKKICDKLNIHTCARNLMLQDRMLASRRAKINRLDVLQEQVLKIDLVSKDAVP